MLIFNWHKGLNIGRHLFTVPNGSVANNRIMKYDMKAQGWMIFGIYERAVNVGFDNIHFEAPRPATSLLPVGAAMSAKRGHKLIWESGLHDNVYVTRNFDKLSLFFVVITLPCERYHNIEPSTSISYNVALTQTDGGRISIITGNYPPTNGSIFNLKVANNAADKPWRFYGSIIDYTDDEWVACNGEINYGKDNA